MASLWSQWLASLANFLRQGYLMKNKQILIKNTDYGRLIKPFFIKILNFWGWADNLGTLIFENGIWGIFGRFISTHFGIVSPLSMFFINQPLFLQKKLSLSIQIPNIYLGLGFEFGPKRIRDLAIVCP